MIVELRRLMALATSGPFLSFVLAHEPECGQRGGQPVLWSEGVVNPEEDPEEHIEFGPLVDDKGAHEPFTSATCDLIAAALNALPALLLAVEALEAWREYDEDAGKLTEESSPEEFERSYGLHHRAASLRDRALALLSPPAHEAPTAPEKP